MRALKLEFYKIRRKKIVLMILLLLAAEMMWAFMSTSVSISRNPDHAVWASILFTTASLNGLFMPMMTAIIVSRLCDMEHKGSTWKLLGALDVSRGRLYAAKYGCAAVLLLLAVVLQAMLMTAFGFMQGFADKLPAEWLVRYIGGTLLVSLAAASVQQWISMTVRNQAFALCLGMLGSFVGLTGGLFPEAVRRWLIWAHYMDLSPVTIRYADHVATFVTQALPPDIAAFTAGTAAACFLFGGLHAARKEI